MSSVDTKTESLTEFEKKAKAKILSTHIAEEKKAKKKTMRG